MKKNKPIRFRNKIYILFGVILLAGCSQFDPVSVLQNTPVNFPTKSSEITTTPFLPIENVPEGITGLPLNVPDGYKPFFELLVGGMHEKILFDKNAACEFGESIEGQPNINWILALTAPFNTITDSVNSQDLTNFLIDKQMLPTPFTQLVTTQNVLDVLRLKFGQKLDQVIVVNQVEISDYLYAHPQTLAVIPFETLTPALKVLRIDEISPYDQDFSPDAYYFSVHLSINCQNEGDDFLGVDLPNWTNRDPQKLTSVLLTGTTALTRAIGKKMEVNGMQYPGEKVKHWFDAADISHISNEVSYYDGCPPADPNQTDLLFCGRTEYTDLFTYLGVDVIELTGNHLADKGISPLVDMMALFDTQGISYYAAGVDKEAASQPLYLENNGNRIAFLGCNDAGPNFVFAADYRAGVNQCDMDQMAARVKQVAEEGYLPIVTFQYWESFQFEPMPYQRNDFRIMIENGAVIVSGSQAHLPMTMEAYKHGFIHYGLGNLFFDQMDVPVVGTRREFVDRHIFYDGRYLGVDLLTAMLEDYSQPRPMTTKERRNLLSDAFVDFIYLP